MRASPPPTWHDADGLSWKLDAFGPAALRLEADAPPSAELSQRLARLRAAAWAGRTPAVRDVIVGYRTLTLELRPGAPTGPAARALLRAVNEVNDWAGVGRSHLLPVDYGRSADQEALEQRLGMPWSQVVAAHRAAEYTVAFLGFTPGFPYLHGLPSELATPRRTAPRPDVPAGAVAIADGQAGIYPVLGPGGWWVLGISPEVLFDPDRAQPATLAAGDRLRFVPLDEAPASPPSPASIRSPRRQAEVAISVLDSWPGGASLQGRPRPSVAHLGMAQAGALDAEAFRAANHLAGAAWTEPALEFLIPHATLVAERPLVAAWTGGGAQVRLDGREVQGWQPFRWPAGSTLELRPATGASGDPGRGSGGAIAMLAVGGGLRPAGGDAGHPVLAGEGSTDLRARVGGFGRSLMAGDRLALASSPRPPGQAWGGRPRFDDHVVLRLHPGPHGEGAAVAALLNEGFRLLTRDRMAARLALQRGHGSGGQGNGIQVERGDVASEAMPLGAVQLPANGQPIVLLHDRGRTGGYPVLGVVDHRDLSALVQARPGAEIRFLPTVA